MTCLGSGRLKAAWEVPVRPHNACFACVLDGFECVASSLLRGLRVLLIVLF